MDVTGLTTIDFSALFAEDTSNDGEEDWDGTSSVRVEYQLDGGTLQNLIAFEAEIGEDGNQTNEAPRLDTDFNEVGDGTPLTDTFTEFTGSFATNGATSLIVTITIQTLDAGDEDIAIDNVTISGM